MQNEFTGFCEFRGGFPVNKTVNVKLLIYMRKKAIFRGFTGLRVIVPERGGDTAPTRTNPEQT